MPAACGGVVHIKENTNTELEEFQVLGQTNRCKQHANHKFFSTTTTNLDYTTNIVIKQKNMNIAKALKVKNRLIGEVTKLQEIVRRENSRRNDNTSKVDVAAMLCQLDDTREKLIQLKAAIAIASAAISEKLVRLSEKKTYVNWIDSLPTRDGKEKVALGTKEVETYEWKAYYNRQALDELVIGERKAIEKLQDEVDEFNAKTTIAWVE